MIGESIVWSPGTSLDEIEKQVILKAFRHFRGNKTVTSNALGISIRTLDSKLEKYGADGKSEEASNEQRRQEREIQLARARGFAPASAPAPAVKESSQNGASTESGFRMESTPQPSTEYALPVQVRSKVQKLPSRPSAKSNPRITRTAVSGANGQSRPRLHNERKSKRNTSRG